MLQTKLLLPIEARKNLIELQIDRYTYRFLRRYHSSKIYFLYRFKRTKGRMLDLVDLNENKLQLFSEHESQLKSWIEEIILKYV